MWDERWSLTPEQQQSLLAQLNKTAQAVYGNPEQGRAIAEAFFNGLLEEEAAFCREVTTSIAALGELLQPTDDPKP